MQARKRPLLERDEATLEGVYPTFGTHDTVDLDEH